MRLTVPEFKIPHFINSETCDQILLPVWQLLSCFCGAAFSDERTGLRVCSLQCNQSVVQVSQYILVSSSLRDLQPDINSVWKLLFGLCGVPSLMRGRVCLFSITVNSIIHCQFLFSFHMSHMFYVYTMYTRPLSAQAQYSRSCPIICSLCYNSSLITWMVIYLTTTKFKPLKFWELPTYFPLI
jgi:hypothetical protein